MTETQKPDPTKHAKYKRGVGVNPNNRFAPTEHETVHDDWPGNDEDIFKSINNLPGTLYLDDVSKTILSKNDSPDIGFTYSVNPYRGCEHACTYCYARPTHEWLGMTAGRDFETRIMVKHEAPQLLRKELMKESWTCEPIALSGVTDCYQAAEKQFGLTRGCLEVMWQARNPAVLITKSVLILRDLELFRHMAEHNLVRIFISLTTLDPLLASRMEPGASPPALRLHAIKSLSRAGVPVGVMLAPMVPGLTDQEIPALLQAAHEAGAKVAGFTPLRLPYSVKDMFIEWIRRAYPDRASKVESRIRDMRGGELNVSDFGSRMRGQGIMAEHMRSTFSLFLKKYDLDQDLPGLNTADFRRPGKMQQRLLF